jgi:hypothetical protein
MYIDNYSSATYRDWTLGRGNLVSLSQRIYIGLVLVGLA